MAKFNMSPEKNPMPTLDPIERGKCFDEVAIGYSEAAAIDEAMRCLGCKNMPCVSGCPVNIHIPEFIAKIREGDFEGAYEIITKSSTLPAVCGRVCPQETQCESKCVRGIKGEPVGTAFVLKSILSDMSIATPAFFWSLFAWKIFFQPFTFSLYVSPVLRWVSCRQHM